MVDDNKIDEQKITVAGVTFSAEQVKSAVITINDRDIEIKKIDKKKDKVGFKNS